MNEPGERVAESSLTTAEKRRAQFLKGILARYTAQPQQDFAVEEHQNGSRWVVYAGQIGLQCGNFREVTAVSNPRRYVQVAPGEGLTYINVLAGMTEGLYRGMAEGARREGRLLDCLPVNSLARFEHYQTYLTGESAGPEYAITARMRMGEAIEIERIPLIFASGADDRNRYRPSIPLEYTEYLVTMPADC